MYRPLIGAIPKEIRPFHLVVDGDDLFWQTFSSTLYRGRAGGSAVAAGPVFSSNRPFAVTADEILYNFTRYGYDTAPR